MRKLILLTLMLAGCATVVHKDLQFVGGSKANGVVTLALAYGSGQQAQWSWAQGQQVADTRCQGWGYKSASRFDNGQEFCSWSGEILCFERQVTVQYQCVN